MLNWVPIRPLDGGQLLTSALQIPFPKRGEAIAMVFSFLFGVAAVLFLASNGQTFAAVFIGLIVLAGMRSEPGSSRSPQPQQSPSQTPESQPAPRQPHERPGSGRPSGPASPPAADQPRDPEPPAFPI